MVWVNEDGKSECLAVMARIGVLPIAIGMRHSKEGPLPSGAPSRERCNQTFKPGKSGGYV